jgi:uncharacterized NAD(P)/FAD-binding protein YdhS
MASSRTIVIAGAGFSGVVTAAQILRGDADGPLRVVLINRSGTMARGVAYGTNSPAHVLNVPAGRMGAAHDDPEGFLRYARAQNASITPDAFVPRSLYGDYLEDFLAEAARAARPGVCLDRLVGEVTSIEPTANGAGARVSVSDGMELFADRVVLALGNYPPEDIPVADPSFYGSRLYVRDPWMRGALDAASACKSVLLIGTGLTMLDIALELSARGVSGPMYAVSRHGLLPQAHHVPAIAPGTRHRPPCLQAGPATARAYLRAVREQVRQLAAEGEDWRPVVDSIRPLTPGLWHALKPKERARFLRHVRPFWEVHRHRAAPVAAAAFQRLLDRGQLQIRAGRIQGYELAGDSVRVCVRPRGSDTIEHFTVGAVVNCTGPSGDLRMLRDPLIDFLRKRDMVRPDALGLGLETSEDGALLDASGKPSPFLYYVGPLLKASHWESTAVPELRVHAARLAATLTASLAELSEAGAVFEPRSADFVI